MEQPLPALSDPAPKPLNCRRCGIDLSPLIQLHDQAIWHYSQAIRAFHAGDYPTAAAQTQQALALDDNNAHFHALSGQIEALQGEFRRAITAWKKPRNSIPSIEQLRLVSNGLQKINGLLHLSILLGLNLPNPRLRSLKAIELCFKKLAVCHQVLRIGII